MKSKILNLRSDSGGISPIVATVLLILATLVAGGMAFVAIRSQTSSLTSNASVQAQSLGLTKAGGTAVATVTVKNTGTVNVDSVSVTISADSDIGLSISNLESGQSKGADNTTFDSGWVTVGETYPVTISVEASDGSTLNSSAAVTCRSS